MKYLIAIDSDGTLRRSDGTISTDTKKIIKKLRDLGHTVVITTARPRYHTLKISNEVGIDDYLISSNGSEVYYVENIFPENSNYIPYEESIKIYEDTKKLNLRVMFVVDDTEYVTIYKRNDDQILLDDSNINDLKDKLVKQIMIIGSEKDKILSYKEIISKNKNLKIVDSSNDYKEEIWFSVVNNSSSKGSAIKELANYLCIPRKYTIAIGNDNNDISMIETANIGVAVENATNELKQKASVITKCNDEDGVLLFLKNKFFSE